ncbi:hypothetical protein BWI17_00390 [Betaproteobacteria bacterium GR16-43]|nr:hypothetical protein BWI17_00390 [Betaproteobacteria bacterium GR16-43]
MAGTVTIRPEVPKAYEDFVVSVTDGFSLAYNVNPRVFLGPQGLIVDLNGFCGFLCSGPVTQTFSARAPGLPPGRYPLTVYSNMSFQFPLVNTSSFEVVAAPNYQGLWWNAPAGSESGWGLNIAHQDETLFATWFTYDDQGRDTWLVMSNGAKTGDGAYAGTLYRTAAAPAPGKSFQTVAAASITPVGTMTLRFSDTNNATFTYDVDGVRQTKAITKQVYGSAPARCYSAAKAVASPTYQDLWWSFPATSVSGWGLNVTQQDGTLFMTLFGYDGDGRPSWRVASNVRAVIGASYAGDLYRTSGAPFRTSPWPSSSVKITRVGTVEFRDSGSEAVGFNYSEGNERTTHQIVRQRFGAAPTVCD